MFPRIALTSGDPAGIGPEVALRACLDDRVRRVCQPLIVGHPHVLHAAAVRASLAIRIVETDGAAIRSIEPGDPTTVICWNPGDDDDAAAVEIGRVSAAAGHAAWVCLDAATRAALDGRIDAITTAPLNKAALHAAGHFYPGHTEILAEICGVDDFAMMLYLSDAALADICRTIGTHAEAATYGLGITHVTLHTSIRSVPDRLSTQAISETIHLADAFTRRLGCTAPRIGVCALNPHAGEDGLFGDEERTIIAPAIRIARSAGLDATGPLPADTLIRRAVRGEFDSVVAMYHDQGHIPFKLIGFHNAINVTLGLPIVRTSPSHGTAFDIAAQGRADPRGMIEAILTAVRLAT